jgi:hypothetical protein
VARKRVARICAGLSILRGWRGIQVLDILVLDILVLGILVLEILDLRICTISEVTRAAGRQKRAGSAQIVDWLDHGGRVIENNLAHRTANGTSPVHDDYPPRTGRFDSCRSFGDYLAE